MIRRTLTIAAVCAVASAGLVGTAYADSTCVTQDEGTFAGTVVCVDTNNATSGSTAYTYTITPDCINGICTPGASDTIYVPRVNGNVVYAYGTLCYELTPKSAQVCRSFTTYNILNSIAIGDL